MHRVRILTSCRWKQKPRAGQSPLLGTAATVRFQATVLRLHTEKVPGVPLGAAVGPSRMTDWQSHAAGMMPANVTLCSWPRRRWRVCPTAAGGGRGVWRGHPLAETRELEASDSDLPKVTLGVWGKGRGITGRTRELFGVMGSGPSLDSRNQRPRVRAGPPEAFPSPQRWVDAPVCLAGSDKCISVCFSWNHRMERSPL